MDICIYIYIIYIYKYIYIYICTEFFRRRCGRLFCRYPTDSDADREVFYVKKIQNGSNSVAKTTNMEPKGSQQGAKREPRKLQKLTYGTGSKKVAKKGSSPGTKVGTTFYNIFLKVAPPEIMKKRSPWNMDISARGVPTWYQKRCQQLSKINAKTGKEKNLEHHQQSCFSEWQNH